MLLYLRSKRITKIEEEKEKERAKRQQAEEQERKERRKKESAKVFPLEACRFLELFHYLSSFMLLVLKIFAVYF